MKVGVVIGRFQVEILHPGHRFIINSALKNHKTVIVLIGCSPVNGTRYDPLDYPSRERMIRAEFPEAFILPVKDCQTNEKWSEQVDSLIETIVPNVKEAVLYGGRGSFVPHYFGKHKAVEIDGGFGYQSGTEQRKEIGKLVRNSPDFRAGIIYSTQNSFPYTKMCVDIALLDKKNSKILLGRKNVETKWRIPGGAVDKGETLENAAARELKEETSIDVETQKLEYISSAPVGDWRYEKAGEVGLMTALFAVDYEYGEPKAGDDLTEVKWFPITDAEKMVVNAHKSLIKAVKRRF